MTALQQDLMRLRKELKQSKLMLKKAQKAAERYRLETEASVRKALEINKPAGRTTLEAEQAAERKLTATVLNLLQAGLRIETISRCAGLPLEAIQKLAQQLGQGETNLT